MNIKMGIGAMLLLAALSLGQASPQETDPIAKLTREDPARGKRLFEAHCALCHGQTGTGGAGPSLARPALRRAATNQDLFSVIQDGIRGSEMEGAWQLTDREVWQVAGYVRSLGRTPVERLPGDPARGEKIYEAQGCSACHIVRGRGHGLGPELTDVGARRSSAYLRESLLEPAKSAPEGFLMVRAVMRDGREVPGIRVSEDSFTIQLRDASGNLHSFRKSRLAKLEKLPGQTPMPAYGTLSGSELDDLVAYLAGLRGEP